MFQQFLHIRQRVDSGDNSPRLKEQRVFGLSTHVENPVDNFPIAVEAGFSTLTGN